MSRSTRAPAHHFCFGADPRGGKAKTSRAIRRGVKVALHCRRPPPVRADDRNRGRAGSRSSDHGWKWFGDGKANPFRPSKWHDPETEAFRASFREKNSRK